MLNFDVQVRCLFFLSGVERLDLNLVFCILTK